MNNHIIDPTFFYEAINRFSFSYDAYIIKTIALNDYGEQQYTYNKLTIYGSLQSQGTSLQQSKSGNTNSVKYKFYCKSLYRVNIGDFIHYKDKWLRIDNVQDYDEYGVRECDLTMVQLNAYKDLKEYVEYIEGSLIV